MVISDTFFLHVCVCKLMLYKWQGWTVKSLTSWCLSCLWSDIIRSASRCSFQNVFVERSDHLRLMSIRLPAAPMVLPYLVPLAISAAASPELYILKPSCPPSVQHHPFWCVLYMAVNFICTICFRFNKEDYVCHTVFSLLVFHPLFFTIFGSPLIENIAIDDFISNLAFRRDIMYKL